MAVRPKSKIYDILNHPKDLAVEIYGNSMEEIYNNAVRAFTDLLLGLKGLRGTKKRELEIVGVDESSLLVNLLNELIFLFEIEDVVSTGISKMEIEGMTMRATIKYQVVDRSQKPVLRQIKAAKLNSLKIKRLHDGYHCLIVFDI